MTEFFGSDDQIEAAYDPTWQLDPGSEPAGSVLGDLENIASDAGGDLERAGESIVDTTVNVVKDAGVDGLNAIKSFGSDIAEGHPVAAIGDLVGGALDSAAELGIGAVFDASNAIMGVGAAVVATGVDAVDAGLDVIGDIGKGIEDVTGLDISGALGDAASAVGDGILAADEAMVDGMFAAGGAIEDAAGAVGDGLGAVGGAIEDLVGVDIGGALGDAASAVGDGILAADEAMVDGMFAVGGAIEDAGGTVVSAVGDAVDAVDDAASAVGGAVEDVIDDIADLF
jgi:hypothetical protein